MNGIHCWIELSVKRIVVHFFQQIVGISRQLHGTNKTQVQYASKTALLTDLSFKPGLPPKSIISGMMLQSTD